MFIVVFRYYVRGLTLVDIVERRSGRSAMKKGKASARREEGSFGRGGTRIEKIANCKLQIGVAVVNVRESAQNKTSGLTRANARWSTRTN
jgi:hypothetical protein